MPQVLTTNAMIVCPHGGVGTTAPSRPFWKVNDGHVCVDGDLGSLTCIFATPCVGYTLASMGLNATQIMGRNVMLVTDFVQSITGVPLSVTETQTTTYDDSTTTPIPVGASAPPLPPGLQSTVPPIVEALPLSSPAFSKTSGPPTITGTFTLSSPFPLRWVLTRIGLVAPANHDILTNGKPPGVTVAPSGGVWNDSPLTVTMTMTAAYMTTLAQGGHQFYMTGVSQRGISSHATVILTVGP
jgi:hypothetical protein